MSQQIIMGETEAKILARVKLIAATLLDMREDGLSMYNPDRPEDLVIRDVEEYIWIKQHRAKLIPLGELAAKNK